MAAWRSVSKRKRTKLGPTRYFPRCKNRGCVKPLSNGKHVGVCEDCREAFVAMLTGK